MKPETRIRRALRGRDSLKDAERVAALSALDKLTREARENAREIRRLQALVAGITRKGLAVEPGNRLGHTRWPKRKTGTERESR